MGSWGLTVTEWVEGVKALGGNKKRYWITSTGWFKVHITSRGTGPPLQRRTGIPAEPRRAKTLSVFHEQGGAVVAVGGRNLLCHQGAKPATQLMMYVESHFSESGFSNKIVQCGLEHTK